MKQTLESGAALKKLKEMIVAQGGNPEVIDHYELFPQAKDVLEISASENGYVSDIMAQEIGLAVKTIGAGREKIDDILDLSAGVYLKKKVGDAVKKGETIAVLYGNDREKMQVASARIGQAYKYSSDKPVPLPMIYAVITKGDL